MNDYDWYGRPMLARAPAGGYDEFGKHFAAGEFLPFYVPRPLMPQIDEADLPDFLIFANAQGVQWSQGRIPPNRLHAHQRVEVDRVRHMDPALLEKPVLISADGYVLDGNHRWHAAWKLKLPDIPAVSLTTTFELGIALMFSFPKTYTIVPGEIRN